MDRRKRLIVGGLWIGVAVVMATTLDVGIPSSAGGIARLFVVGLALFLAGVYLLDPWNVVSAPFRQG
jgi:predicted phage tail protein